jgi:hypothetical protein
VKTIRFIPWRKKKPVIDPRTFEPLRREGGSTLVILNPHAGIMLLDGIVRAEQVHAVQEHWDTRIGPEIQFALFFIGGIGRTDVVDLRSEINGIKDPIQVPPEVYAFAEEMGSRVG